VIQAAANALLATWHPRDNPEEQARLVYAAHETATEIMAAAAPLIRAAVLEEAAKAVEAAGDGFKPELGPLGDGCWYADLYATFLRGLAEEGTE
jgi:hypothetical protein